MIGICELYKIKAQLQESHIFPKFVIKYNKKTGSKYLRQLVEPNKRIQDGLKLHLLSKKAEQEFGKREKWFSENIFHPYLKNETELTYNEDLFYFAISFLWRVLVLELKKSPDIEKKWHYKSLINCEKEWRNFLTNSTFPLNFSNANLFFTEVDENHNVELKGVNVYLTRTLDATIIDTKDQNFLAIYGKFNKFIFWSVLVEYGEEDRLNSLKINPIGGLFKTPQTLNYFPMNSFLYNRIKGINEHHLPNEEQQDKILSEINKNPDVFWNSEMGKAIKFDINSKK